MWLQFLILFPIRSYSPIHHGKQLSSHRVAIHEQFHAERSRFLRQIFKNQDKEEFLLLVNGSANPVSSFYFHSTKLVNFTKWLVGVNTVILLAQQFNGWKMVGMSMSQRWLHLLHFLRSVWWTQTYFGFFILRFSCFCGWAQDITHNASGAVDDVLSNGVIYGWWVSNSMTRPLNSLKGICCWLAIYPCGFLHKYSKSIVVTRVEAVSIWGSNVLVRTITWLKIFIGCSFWLDEETCYFVLLSNSLVIGRVRNSICLRAGI